MRIEPYKIPGLLRVQLDVFRDERGFFSERYNQKNFDAEFDRLGFAAPRFVQDNLSRSAPGVLRGLHGQIQPGQAKLIGVLRGKIWDVAVDLRKGSPTYGQHASIELDDESGILFFIPPGFAHGFCVLGETAADVLYKVDQHYDPTLERGVAWNDPTLGVPWPIRDPLISARDRATPPLHAQPDWQGL